MDYIALNPLNDPRAGPNLFLELRWLYRHMALPVRPLVELPATQAPRVSSLSSLHLGQAFLWAGPPKSDPASYADVMLPAGGAAWAAVTCTAHGRSAHSSLLSQWAFGDITFSNIAELSCQFGEYRYFNHWNRTFGPDVRDTFLYKK